MSYTSDQFFNFKQYEPNTSIARGQDDNANFIFPGPTTPNVFTKNVDTKFQRGFMRGIYPSAIKRTNPNSQIKQRRLFFQFNPATIDRTVSMSEIVVNPLLQDPAMLFQPVPGSADFSFELLFNREAEVNSGLYANELGALTPAPPPWLDRFDGLSAYGQMSEQSDVSTLGVLADMYVLDSIIGQSITPDMVGFLQSYYNLTTQANNNAARNAASGADPANEDGTTKPIDEQVFDSSLFAQYSQQFNNFGNSAFLSPLPIRIVFSSLFMVEGFVTRSSVQFVKFSKNYIPTVCKVTLDLRALYMGFAREKSFVSEAINQAVADLDAQQQADNIAQNEAQESIAYGIYFRHRELQILAAGSKVGDPDNSDYFYAKDSSATTWKEFLESIPTWWSQNNYVTNKGILFEGLVDTWVDPHIAEKVKNGQFTWTFDATVSLEEEADLNTGLGPGITIPGYGVPGVRRILYKSPLLFEKLTGDTKLSFDEVASNANNGTSSKPRENDFESEKKPLSEYTLNPNKKYYLVFTYNVSGNVASSSGSGLPVNTTLTNYFLIDPTAPISWAKWNDETALPELLVPAPLAGIQ